MLSNPIRASNNSQMLLGGAGISRSLREKTKGPRPAVMLITCFILCIVWCMFQVVAHGLQSAYPACSVCAERERERLLFCVVFFC